MAYDYSGLKNQEIILNDYNVVSYEVNTSHNTIYIFATSEGLCKFLEYNIETGVLIRESNISQSELFVGIVFPNKKLIATGQLIRVNVWDKETMENVHTFRSHKRNVLKLTVSFDNTKLVSSDVDGVLKVYDTDK